MAIVNEDVLDGTCVTHTDGCVLGARSGFFDDFDYDLSHRRNLSCRFLSHLPSGVLSPAAYFTHLEEALESIRSGRHWGVLHFKANYTEALFKRLFGLVQLELPDADTLDRSEVHAHLDMTNQQVSLCRVRPKTAHCG